MSSPLSEEFNQLDSELFICTNCKGEFLAVDGTWPRHRMDGTPIYTYSVNSDAADDSLWPKPMFYCYDCADQATPITMLCP